MRVYYKLKCTTFATLHDFLWDFNVTNLTTVWTVSVEEAPEHKASYFKGLIN
jgi:hypothetical protein